MIEAGIHDLDATAYHADPCPAPSLSSSLAKLLLDRSPWHAWRLHPKLGGEQQESSDVFDLGTACHSLVLEGEDNVVVVAAEDWRTKDAKAQRDAAREAGKVALLQRHYTAVHEMAKRLTLQLATVEDRGLLDPTAGRAEMTLVWQERNGVWCRARPDWLRDDNAMIADYKTCGNAEPSAFIRQSLFPFGYDLQAAFYLRGLRAVTGKQGSWRWVAQETSPPYAASVIAPLPAVIELADKKVERAVQLWGECLKADRWLGYGHRTAWADLPTWRETAWLERETREAAESDLPTLAAG